MTQEPEMITSILGHPPQYWFELERRFEAVAIPNGVGLLTEIVELRGKVSFYESRIKQMAALIK